MSVKALDLPHASDGWPKRRDHLVRIRDGEIKDLRAFEEVYKELQYENTSGQSPTLVCLRNVLAKDHRDHFTEQFFLEKLLPWIASTALQLEELFKEPRICLLRKQKCEEVILTRRQVCCILAHAFFSTLASPSYNYQQLSLLYILGGIDFPSQKNKVLCILNYFDRVQLAEEASDEEFLSSNVSVERRAINTSDEATVWKECTLPLSPFVSNAEGLIEADDGALQVDFANEYIGGGVLSMGNVQEEIRFVINPECLVSMLFCESMDDNEAILIRGAEQFSKYKGYGGRFKYDGAHIDSNPFDPQGRRCVSIVAIDATPQSFGVGSQYRKENILRELNKAFCGFSFSIPGDVEEKRPVATGNWGCGAFGGDKELKTLIQWMATSRAGRPITYFTFHDKSLHEAQSEAVKALKEKITTVGQMYSLLLDKKTAIGPDGGVFGAVVAATEKL